MKAIIALLLGVSIASSVPQWMQEMTKKDLKKIDTLKVFKEWTKAFDRDYNSTEEEAHRYLVWLDNLHTIAQTNSNKELTYKLRLNQFGDMTSDEFKYYVHGDKGHCFNPLEKKKMYIIGGDDSDYLHDQSINAPASIDWTNNNGKSYVTPVKNQGQCGSCWAFSTTGALECNYAIKHDQLNSLSEQELVDCAPRIDGCMGCNGGQMDGAFKYVEKNGGLCSEKDYKYTAKDGQCEAAKCGTKYDANSGYMDVTSDSSTSLKSAVAEGCVSVAIEADQTAFQHYSSGVLTGSCGTSLDHGVLVVGYGTSGSQDYWKVKNSWGTSWGEDGYILICRDCNKNGNKGECGILGQPSYPKF